MDRLNREELDFAREVLAPLYRLIWPVDGRGDENFMEELREAALDYEVVHGLDENYNPTQQGLLAIRIADKLT